MLCFNGSERIWGICSLLRIGFYSKYSKYSKFFILLGDRGTETDCSCSFGVFKEGFTTAGLADNPKKQDIGNVTEFL